MKLAEGLDPSKYVSCMSQEAAGSFQGRVTDYLEKMELRSDDLYYLCGNPLAIKDLADRLLSKGVADARIIREFYYAY